MKTKHFIHRLSAGVAVGLIVSLAALGLAETASAQTGNGLKDIKGKADAFGGAGDDDGMGDTAGSLALSFARRWYVQGDGLIGIGRGDTNWALGGHIFWYDPKIGILDFNVSFLDFKVRHVTRAGVHGQYFWGKITLRGNVGYQIIGGVARDSVFGGASVAFHQIPGAVVEVGADGYRQQGIFWAHGEVLLPLKRWFGQRAPQRRVALWLNAGGGNDNYWHVLAGVRVFFGGCNGPMIQLQRGCGAPNPLRRLIAILRPAIRRDRNIGGTDGGGRTSFVFSDRRLKTDVVLVGTLPNGLKLYSYRYIWGGGRHLGVMAQEAMMWRPDAVTRGPSGFLKVDYSKLN